MRSQVMMRRAVDGGEPETWSLSSPVGELRDRIMNDPSALIIEGDKDEAELYVHILESLGFVTQIVRTSEAALVKLTLSMPDLVVLDLHLPSYISGTEVLQQIQADPRLAETRVIVITAYPALADRVRDAADLVLVKPVDVTQLRDAIQRLRPGSRSN